MPITVSAQLCSLSPFTLAYNCKTEGGENHKAANGLRMRLLLQNQGSRHSVWVQLRRGNLLALGAPGLPRLALLPLPLRSFSTQPTPAGERAQSTSEGQALPGCQAGGEPWARGHRNPTRLQFKTGGEAGSCQGVVEGAMRSSPAWAHQAGWREDLEPALHVDLCTRLAAYADGVRVGQPSGVGDISLVLEQP